MTTAESIEPSMLPTTILSQLALCSAHRRCKNEGVQTARRGVYKKNEDGYHDRRSFMNHHLGSFHSTVTNIQRTSLCSPSDFDGMLFFLWCVVPRLRSSRGHCWVDRTRYAQSGEVWGCIFSLTLFSAILLPNAHQSNFTILHVYFILKILLDPLPEVSYVVVAL